MTSTRGQPTTDGIIELLEKCMERVFELNILSSRLFFFVQVVLHVCYVLAKCSLKHPQLIPSPAHDIKNNSHADEMMASGFASFVSTHSAKQFINEKSFMCARLLHYSWMPFMLVQLIFVHCLRLLMIMDRHACTEISHKPGLCVLNPFVGEVFKVMK